MSEPAPLEPSRVESALAAALDAVARTTDLEALAAVRVEHAGDRSPLALANRAIRDLPPAERAAAGRRVGEARARVAAALAARRTELEAERDERALRDEAVDVTLPVDRRPRGARHPLPLLAERMADVFLALGWDVLEGPEVEAEWFNFDALNFLPDHPAREMQDTFFVDPPGSGLVLRTHTSPVQARALLERGVPLYAAVPGRVFRTDEVDATHSPVFGQVEGIAVDEGLTMAHLRGTLDALGTALFGPGATTRLRPSYFPFTEPSAEMDLRCFVCAGADPGCRPCGGTGWIEWGGCGMVNPAVLRACGVDPQRWQGFAFGVGIERALMFRSGVADMREMLEGDVRFSRQFGTDV